LLLLPDSSSRIVANWSIVETWPAASGIAETELSRGGGARPGADLVDDLCLHLIGAVVAMRVVELLPQGQALAVCLHEKAASAKRCPHITTWNTTSVPK
jgi:hypothetical protein